MDIREWFWGVSQKLAEDFLKPVVIAVGTVVMAWLEKRDWCWVRPLLCGLVTAVCLYILLYGIGPSVPQEQPWHAGFAEGQIYRLRPGFLQIPRPCLIKVTAPPENMGYRGDLIGLAMNASVGYLNRTERIIEPCRIVEDAKDKDPGLYGDQLNFAPPGFIVVNAAPSHSETAEFLAGVLRSQTGLKVRPGAALPPGSPEDLIYIQIGTGSLHG